VNDEAVGDVTAGNYASLSRAWQAGDTVRLSLPIRYLEAHPYVFEATGRVALARGPLNYCAEGLDQGVEPRDLIVPDKPEQLEAVSSGEFGGAVLLQAQAFAESPDMDYLYRLVEARDHNQLISTTLTAIPYYSWANRKPSPIQVWLRQPG